MLVGEIAYKMVGYRQPPPSYSTKQSTGFDHCSTEANTIYTVFYLICECQKIVLMEIRLIGPFLQTTYLTNRSSMIQQIGPSF